jgi:hypothetical protein
MNFIFGVQGIGLGGFLLQEQCIVIRLSGKMGIRCQRILAASD